MNEHSDILRQQGLSVTSKALSPLDGRYAARLPGLADALSEFALMRSRVEVEIEWFIALSLEETITDLPPLSDKRIAWLRDIVANFDEGDFDRIRDTERVINHDMKAVEYFIKNLLDGTELATSREWVHFCCTSEDINNLAYGLMLRRAVSTIWLPKVKALRGQIAELAHRYRNVAFITRTHGQPATPSTIGKELAVFAYRLERQIKATEAAEYLGKINGAVGTFSAHVLAYPDAPWEAIARRFVESLGLTYNPLTTQIESHDYMAELFHVMSRTNAICNNLALDAWLYISIGYFAQIPKAGEVGSSTMPHKINPIDFENGEANFGLANALLLHLAGKLANSRLQRDLSDSSALRSIGSAFGYACIGIDSLSRGLGKIAVNAGRIDADLVTAWETLGEGVQTVMRRAGIAEPYEKMKALTRGAQITREDLAAFIADLELPEADKQRLTAIGPADYVGLASKLVDNVPLD